MAIVKAALIKILGIIIVAGCVTWVFMYPDTAIDLFVAGVMLVVNVLQKIATFAGGLIDRASDTAAVQTL